MEANKNATLRLIGLLSNIQTLQLLPGHIFFTHYTRSEQITSLQICLPQSELISMQYLRPVLNRASLRDLRITNIQSWSCNTELVEGIHDAQDDSLQSSISHLAISSSVCSARTMEAILYAPRGLTSLHYHYGKNTSANDNAIRSSNFSTPLLPHRSSLKELVIYVQPFQPLSQQHPMGDVMHTMRDFTALKLLALPAWWMVHPGSADYQERQGACTSFSTQLVEILPPNLEVLQVQLLEIRVKRWNQAPFAHLSHPENVLENDSVMLRWLREIATWKQDYVPFLRKVVVWSSYLKLPHEERMLQDSGIQEAFREKGVTMTFEVCSPESPSLFGINIAF